MRVLVIGGTGFVGGAVVRALVADGHQVQALVRSLGRGAELASAGVSMQVGDMTAPQTYVGLAREVDAVIHAAQLSTSGRLTQRKVDRVFAADAVATRALADVCSEVGNRLVYTGGCFDWGDGGERLLNEDSPLAPSPMGVGHAAMAVELARRASGGGLDYVRVVPGFVYGPGGLFASAFVDQVRRGRLRVLGSGTNVWSCVHVDDLGRAFALAAALGGSGRSYTVADDESLTLRALTDATTDALDMKRVGTIPAALLGLIIGRPLVASLATSFRLDSTRIRSELGWRPTYATFSEGVGPSVKVLLGKPA
jgi:nucleoside-diphosphate-sugar epimerase